jgi:hypothetical protein
MNYGQMQRWEDFVPLTYSIAVPITSFSSKIECFFEEFRQTEIKENDVEDFAELVEFKNAGWQSLKHLTDNNPDLLARLVRYNDYDILHLLLDSSQKRDYYYSVNSIEEVKFSNSKILISGTCFKSDYVEHTYNHKQTRKYALLKHGSQ